MNHTLHTTQMMTEESQVIPGLGFVIDRFVHEVFPSPGWDVRKRMHLESELRCLVYRIAKEDDDAAH